MKIFNSANDFFFGGGVIFKADFRKTRESRRPNSTVYCFALHWAVMNIPLFMPVKCAWAVINALVRANPYKMQLIGFARSNVIIQYKYFFQWPRFEFAFNVIYDLGIREVIHLVSSSSRSPSAWHLPMMALDKRSPNRSVYGVFVSKFLFYKAVIDVANPSLSLSLLTSIFVYSFSV